MMLPYTIEVFFASMAEYNRATFPAAVVGVLGALTVLALVMRAGARVPATGRGRLVGALLAAAWIWVGAAHQLGHMAALDFMAPVYGVAWIVEGGLLALAGPVLGRLDFGFDRKAAGPVGVAGWTGLVLAVAAIGIYPLVVLALGHGWRSLPLVGTAPDPTAIVTAGLLLLARGPRWLRLVLLLIPMGWGGVAALSGTLLSFPLDYAVPAAVLLAVGLGLRCREGQAVDQDAVLA